MGFQRKTVTIPDTAGETVKVDIKGVSLVTEFVPLYNSFKNVPLMYFESENSEEQPLYPQSTYTFGKKFQRLIIEATPESTGDEISILTTFSCLQEEININTSRGLKAVYDKAQFTKPVAGTGVVTLSDLEISNNDGDFPRAIYIGASGFDLKYSYGADPTGTRGFPLREDAENPTKINSLELIRDLRFANKDTGGGADGTLNILCEY